MVYDECKYINKGHGPFQLQTYLFTVAAFTSAGMGEMSRMASITTGATCK